MAEAAIPLALGGAGALSNLFAPEGQEFESFEGQRGPGGENLDPRAQLGRAVSGQDAVAKLLSAFATSPTSLPSAFVQQPMSFTNGPGGSGGLPMPIGVTAFDQANPFFSPQFPGGSGSLFGPGANPGGTRFTGDPPGGPGDGDDGGGPGGNIFGDGKGRGGPGPARGGSPGDTTFNTGSGATGEGPQWVPPNKPPPGPPGGGPKKPPPGPPDKSGKDRPEDRVKKPPTGGKFGDGTGVKGLPPQGLPPDDPNIGGMDDPAGRMAAFQGFDPSIFTADPQRNGSMSEFARLLAQFGIDPTKKVT